VAHDLAVALRDEPAGSRHRGLCGTAAPFNFNGLVARYYLRRGPNVADLQVISGGQGERTSRVTRSRSGFARLLEALPRATRGAIKIAEVPPGHRSSRRSSRRSTGPMPRARMEAARRSASLFDTTPGVVDSGLVRRGRSGSGRGPCRRSQGRPQWVSVARVEQAAPSFASRRSAGLLPRPPRNARTSSFMVRLPRTPSLASRKSLVARSCRRRGNGRRFRNSFAWKRQTAEKSIYHKNLLPVVYVTGDVSGP